MRARILAVLLLFLALALGAGCGGGIRSCAVITSEPSGATVYWRGEERGETPIEIPFIWYWFYDIRVEKAGYKTIDTMERFRARPWEVFPMDFVLEAMPFPIHDNRPLHYTLEPAPKSDR